MDKNTWIGFLLIAAIIVGFTMLDHSSDASTAAEQSNDSTAVAQADEPEAQQIITETVLSADSIVQPTEEDLAAQRRMAFGYFAPAAEGVEQLDTLENGKVRIVLSTKGGIIQRAELPEYSAAQDKDHALRLFGVDETFFSFTLATKNGPTLQSSDLYFEPVEKSANKMVLRLKTTDEDSWLDYEYELSDNYMVYFRLVPHNLQDKLKTKDKLALEWHQLVPQHEKGRKFEERYAQLQYMMEGGDVEELSESKSDSEKETSPIKWIAYKDQFFSTVFIADGAFIESDFVSEPMTAETGYVKRYGTKTYVPFDAANNKTTGFRFYFGPNAYKTLSAYDDGVDSDQKLHLQNLVPLGWKIVSWINKILVIPMFDLFTGWGLHIGLIILLMTLVIKLIILPFVFASYKSSAKMRVLRPQLNEINEKYPPEKMRERQQATMELYRQAGVSPMSGCLPMLFQFPILMAMFWFLPTAIELRGKSLFWADDLSTYDAVFQWGFHIPLLGDHLSLFCLLMTVANLGYTYITMQSQATDPNMKFMKYMMYAMPLMFLFIFNDYAAGLSYYYLVSLFITILQTMIFRWALDDKKVLAEMEANKKKRAGKPQSGFMARLEQMQREQQRMARENAKKNMRR